MRLITTDARLRLHLPNIIATVKGETPFIERLAIFLDSAEDWVKTTFTSEVTFNSICGYPDSNEIKIITERLVVAEAMRRGIPSLDIVLTPNGYGVVSTTNLAPASKPRVDRLVGSMVAHRDDCIAALLPKLAGETSWLASTQANFFGSTLFPDFEIVNAIGACGTCMWEKYLELHPQIIELEGSLAEEWFSPELMAHFRRVNLSNMLSNAEASVVSDIKGSIITYLRTGSFFSRRLGDTVNRIRLNPEQFPLWHQSETAKLFAPPLFRNEKKSSGYFF